MMQIILVTTWQLSRGLVFTLRLRQSLFGGRKVYYMLPRWSFEMPIPEFL